jgi:hypothetical protein
MHQIIHYDPPRNPKTNGFIGFPGIPGFGTLLADNGFRGACNYIAPGVRSAVAAILYIRQFRLTVRLMTLED